MAPTIGLDLINRFTQNASKVWSSNFSDSDFHGHDQTKRNRFMSGIPILPSITWLQAFLGRIGSCKVCCIITVSWIEGLGDIHGYWIPFASASPIGSTSSTSEGTADIHGYPLPFTVPTASLRWTLHFCWRCTFPDGSENIDKNALIRNQINKISLFSMLFGRDFVATFTIS